MHESVDWPRPPRIAPPRRRRVLLILAALGIVIFGSRIAFSYYVDALWFGSLGYGAVFWKTQLVQWAVFTAFASVTFLVLYGSLPGFEAGAPGRVAEQPNDFYRWSACKVAGGSVVRFIALGISVAIAIGTGAVMMADWLTLALYWHAPQATGSIVDPIFGKPLNFYLFTLPAWQLFAGWLMTLAVITCGVAVFFIVITGGTRALAGRRENYVAITLARALHHICLPITDLAMRVYLGRFEQLFEDHTIFAGVTYTDAHVWIPGMLVVCAGLVRRCGDRSRERRAGATSALAGCRDPSGNGVLSRYSGIRLVRQQLYRQTE